MSTLITLITSLLISGLAHGHMDSGDISIKGADQSGLVYVEAAGNFAYFTLSKKGGFGTVDELFKDKAQKKGETYNLDGDEIVYQISGYHDIEEDHISDFIRNKVSGNPFFEPNFHLFKGADTPLFPLTIQLGKKGHLPYEIEIMASYLLLKNSLEGSSSATPEQSIAYRVQLKSSSISAEVKLFPFNGENGEINVDSEKITL